VNSRPCAPDARRTQRAMRATWSVSLELSSKAVIERCLDIAENRLEGAIGAHGDMTVSRNFVERLNSASWCAAKAAVASDTLAGSPSRERARRAFTSAGARHSTNTAPSPRASAKAEGAYAA
jgi:hypothetical protein